LALRPDGVGLLGPLCAVLGSPAVATIDAGGVESPANNVVTNAGKILDSSPAHEHDRVLLQGMADSRDVGVHFPPIRETHTRDLSQRRVRLLRGRGVDAQANSPLLGGLLEVGCLRLLALGGASLANELLDGRHMYVLAPTTPAGQPAKRAYR
jgi:hypothetical protein